MQMTCPVCGEPETVGRMRCDGATWVECAECGLLRDNETPMPDFSPGPLPPKSEGAERDAKIARALGGDLAAWRNVLDSIESRMPQPWSRGALLEIGCGSGHILDYAKEKGWRRVVGTEIVPDYVHFCRGRGHDVRYFDISNAPIAEEFDLVVACQVMEHAVRPRDLVSGVRDSLSPGGIFWATYCIEWPNADSLVRRGEAYWWTMEAVAHLLETSGMEVVDVQWTKFSLNVMARRMTKDPQSIARRL